MMAQLVVVPRSGVVQDGRAERDSFLTESVRPKLRSAN